MRLKIRNVQTATPTTTTTAGFVEDRAGYSELAVILSVLIFIFSTSVSAA